LVQPIIARSVAVAKNITTVRANGVRRELIRENPDRQRARFFIDLLSVQLYMARLKFA